MQFLLQLKDIYSQLNLRNGLLLTPILRLMKKNLLKFAFGIAVCFVMTSCYTFTATVGRGPQTGIEVVKSNIYLIGGLAPISVADVKAMAGGAKDYEITVTHTFLDGLLTAITGGIYAPTTTIVKK